jgi:hypothetical protein
LTTDIRHISGRDNVVADALSSVEAITIPVTSEALAALQEEDEDLHTLLGRDISLRLENIHFPGTTVTLYCDTSAGKPRR